MNEGPDYEMKCQERLDGNESIDTKYSYSVRCARRLHVYLQLHSLIGSIAELKLHRLACTIQPILDFYEITAATAEH